MLSRRYSHVQAGRVAAPIVAVVGLVGGILAAIAIPGSPSPTFNAVMWGLIGGICGYLVFASEGPVQRPVSVAQAATADGVVAGIITALAGSLVDVISASGAGSSTQGVLSGGGIVAALVLAVLGGALAGAAAGGLALAVGGQDRFSRPPTAQRKKAQTRAGGGNRNTGKRSTRKRTRR